MKYFITILVTIFVIFVIQEELDASLLERVKRSRSEEPEDIGDAGSPYAGILSFNPWNQLN